MRAPTEAPFDIFRQLKEETADIHRQTEACVPVFRDDFDIAAYCELVRRFYGFWCPLEARLARLPTMHQPGLRLASRLKRSLLEHDLRVLGVDPETVRQCINLPIVDTFHKGLGCLYVMEGSTLGSRFIARRLEEHLQLRMDSGAAFFNAYGGEVGPRWVQFRNFVTARVSQEESTDVVDTARDTFQKFYEWLGVDC